MSTARGRLTLHAFILLLLTFVVIAAPTSAYVVLDTKPVSDPSTPAPVGEPELSTRALVKRHDWYVSCGKDPQDNDQKSGIKGPEDIPLARRCIARPYYYSCDSGKLL